MGGHAVHCTLGLQNNSHQLYRSQTIRSIIWDKSCPSHQSHRVLAMVPLQGSNGKWEEANLEIMEVTLNMLEEQRLEASLRQEEIKRWIVKHYNRHIQERNFKSGDSY